MSVTDVYDIREIIQVLQVQEHGIDGEETLARTLDRGSTTQQHQNDTPSTASSGGGTILSSAQTVQTTNHSINVSHDENDPSSAGSNAPLSVNPSMIDSSLSSFLSSLSDSHASHGSVSSMSSQSTPRHSPASFESIGRFLSTDNECDGISVLSLMTEKGEAALEGEKWWEQIEDWDSFTADANNVLKLLILEEMKKKSADDATDNNSSLQNHPAFFGVWKWFQGLYETITYATKTATKTGSNQENIDSERARYVSSLVKQIVAIKQELDELPGEPPSLPKDLTQDDVPDHIREKLLEHNARVNEWRNESMQPRERLEAKYAACREKLLACIIDTEEQLFWKKGAKQQHSDDNKWSSLNDDGYVEVVSEKSSLWDDAETKCQSKSVLSQYATYIAGTIGVGLTVVLSAVLSKRR